MGFDLVVGQTVYGEIKSEGQKDKAESKDMRDNQDNRQHLYIF